MTERERWIVYPLLFLALGAALRDKIIKTTESQRIKCQGLVVVDSEDRPLLVLGAEQFPEMGIARDLLRVDQTESQILLAGQVESNQYVVTQGTKRVLHLNAQNGVAVANLLSVMSHFMQQLQAFQQAQQRQLQQGQGVRPPAMPNAPGTPNAVPNAVPNNTVPQGAARALPPGATLPPVTEPETP
ncbi:hypothetical protein [Aeoliella sp. SH292]|uniref:hypothetical protein n=1 Tax=Aeoliella sp. SH292 TaxID=3454464 RepID=UPI003F9DEFEB